MGKTLKQTKKHWHKTYKPFVWQYFNGKCVVCKKEVEITDGCIHHLTYHYPNLYTIDSKVLIKEGVIVWICHPCHKNEHTAESIKESKSLKAIGRCVVCRKLEGGIWDRMRMEKLSEPLCKNCYQIRKKGGSDQLILF